MKCLLNSHHRQSLYVIQLLTRRSLNPIQTAVQKVKELEEELRKSMEKQDEEIQKQEAQFEKERADHKVISHKKICMAGGRVYI